MSKKLIFVTLIFLLALGIYIFVNFYYLHAQKTQVPQIKIIPPAPSQKASLLMLPSPLTVSASREASLSIVINGNLSQVSDKTIQFELGFDPTVIYNVNIFPGNYLKNPRELLKKIDYQTGRISYALSGSSQSMGNNLVAQITFNALTYAFSKETQIAFLPKTLVRSDNEEVGLVQTKGATIMISQPIYQNFYQASSSAVPSAIPIKH